MIVEITYHDNAKRSILTDEWDALPSDNVQIVRLINPDGTGDLLSGFDFYFQSGRTIGGYLAEPRPWPVNGWIYSWNPGWTLLGSLPKYDPGTIPQAAQRGTIKRGSLIDDDKAAALGLDVNWRPYYLQKCGELGIAP